MALWGPCAASNADHLHALYSEANRWALTQPEDAVETESTALRLTESKKTVGILAWF